MPLNCIPSTRFSSEIFAAGDQFAAWRERISVIFNVEPLEEAVTDGFAAEALGYHLGELVLVNTQFAEQRFIRTPRQLSSDLIDHYLVQFYRRGGYAGDVDGRPIEVGPGSVSVLDLSRPLDTRATSAECVSLVVPRDVMHEALPKAGELHGMVLDDGSGGLLADYLTALERRLPALASEQAGYILRATYDLIAACIRPSMENLERARDQIEPLQLAQIRRYIDGRLGSPEISVEDICWAFQVSRTQLYRLFKSCGGVKRYIQTRRLLRAHAALADPAERRPIAALAESFGFTSQAYFSRAFRQHFGYKPSEARHHSAGAPELQIRGAAASAAAYSDGGNTGFDDWVRSLRV